MPRRETRAEARAESTRDRQRRQRGRRHLTRCLTSARGVRGALGRMRVDTVPFVVDIFQTGNTTSHPSPTPNDPHLPLPIAPVSGSSYLPWATAPSPPACPPSAGTGRTSAAPASSSPACGRYYFPSRSFPWRDERPPGDPALTSSPPLKSARAASFPTAFAPLALGGVPKGFLCPL